MDQVAVLNAPNGTATSSASFGYDVAIAGNYAVIGAHNGMSLGVETGRVYVFVLDGATGAATLLADMAPPALDAGTFGALLPCVCVCVCVCSRAAVGVSV